MELIIGDDGSCLMEDMIPKNKIAVHIPTEVKKYLKKYEDYGIMALGMDTTGLLEFYTELEDK